MPPELSEVCSKYLATPRRLFFFPGTSPGSSWIHPKHAAKIPCSLLLSEEQLSSACFEAGCYRLYSLHLITALGEAENASCTGGSCFKRQLLITVWPGKGIPWCSDSVFHGVHTAQQLCGYQLSVLSLRSILLSSSSTEEKTKSPFKPDFVYFFQHIRYYSGMYLPALLTSLVALPAVNLASSCSGYRGTRALFVPWAPSQQPWGPHRGSRLHWDTGDHTAEPAGDAHPWEQFQTKWPLSSLQAASKCRQWLL